MKIKVDELSAAIDLELSAYSEEIRDGLTDAVKRAANTCVKRLKQTSPKRTGAYAKGWTKKLTKPPDQPMATVYNKDRPWLAHLLENSHGLKGGGYVEAIVHIKPAADEAQKQLFDDTVNMIENLN